MLSKSVAVPATDVDDGFMEDVVDGAVDDDGSVYEETSDEDVQVGVPVQSNVIVANENKSQAHRSTHGNTQAHIHGHTPQSHTEGHGKDTGRDMRETTTTQEGSVSITHPPLYYKAVLHGSPAEEIRVVLPVSLQEVLWIHYL